MSDHGYVLAYRKCWTHPAFNNLLEAAIWNFLYQNAFWQDGERNFNGHTFRVKRGQIVVSIRFLAAGFGMTERATRTVVTKLKKLKMIDTQTTHRATIITICNYDKFQRFEKTDDTHPVSQATHGRHTGDANKKQINNKTNELRKDIPREFIYEGFTYTKEQLFEVLWNIFPKVSTKGNKQKALKSFEKALKGSGHESIINGCKRYSQFIADEGQFNQHLSTWLNQRGWDGEWESGTGRPKSAGNNGKIKEPSYTDKLANASRRAQNSLESEYAVSGQGWGDNRFMAGTTAPNGNSQNVCLSALCDDVSSD